MDYIGIWNANDDDEDAHGGYSPTLLGFIPKDLGHDAGYWHTPGWSIENQHLSKAGTTPGNYQAATARVLKLVLMGYTTEGINPEVSDVSIGSHPGFDRTYVAGDSIFIRLTFTENVSYTGNPSIKIDMHPSWWGVKEVGINRGTDATLEFRWIVRNPNCAPHGIRVVPNSLRLNGGTIRSSDGINAVLTHPGLSHDANHKVDWDGTGSTCPVL